MTPGELERRLSDRAEQAAAARARLDALSREVEAVRGVIFEVAAAIRGAEWPTAASGDEEKTPYAR